MFVVNSPVAMSLMENVTAPMASVATIAFNLVRDAFHLNWLDHDTVFLQHRRLIMR